jgi:lipoyl(octanoyl) transferase
MRNCILENKGLVPYQIAWDYQRSLFNERINNPQLEDILLLLEHPPVYTLGKGADVNFVKFDPEKRDYELHRIERGGEVTYHCPGQLVGYPILNLQHYQTDLHWYLRQLEEVIILVLADYGLKGYRIDGLTGVWLEDKKVAAIGIKVRRWITMHGFSLNVCPDLSGFQHIIPCGIENKSVCSMEQFISDITVEEVKKDVALVFADVFKVNLLVKDEKFQ